MKVFGKLIKKFPVQTGETKNGAQWVKQNILLEQDNQYNKEVVISFFGDEKVKKLQDVEIGEEMMVSCYVSSREYNGKWYHNIDGFTLSTSFANMKDAYKNDQDNNNDLPF